MKRTDDIIDLKNCIDGVQNAMASEDYASAASYVNRYLNFDKSILDRSSVELLETAERNLADIIRMKCDSAIAASDTDLVFKFALLMPLIGNTAQGIEKISVHFSKLLAKDEQAIYAEMDKSVSNNADQKISYAAAVGQLLQRLERRLKRYRAQLETSCGRSGVAQLLINIQSHVNERTLNLLEIFIREWQLQSTVRPQIFILYLFAHQLIEFLLHLFSSTISRSSHHQKAPLDSPRRCQEAAAHSNTVIRANTRLYWIRSWAFRNHWNPMLDFHLTSSRRLHHNNSNSHNRLDPPQHLTLNKLGN
jgi:hypothetical protein